MTKLYFSWNFSISQMFYGITSISSGWQFALNYQENKKAMWYNLSTIKAFIESNLDRTIAQTAKIIKKTRVQKQILHGLCFRCQPKTTSFSLLKL